MIKSVFQKKDCLDVECSERVDCCTTVRRKISEREFNDKVFREWWLLHEGARLYEEDGFYYIHWPMRCKYASDDGLRCMNYENRPENCRLYVCRLMTEE